MQALKFLRHEVQENKVGMLLPRVFDCWIKDKNVYFCVVLAKRGF